MLVGGVPRSVNLLVHWGREGIEEPEVAPVKAR